MNSSRMSIRSLILVAVLALLIVQLNIYFAWTSHVGAATRSFYISNNNTPVRSLLVGEVNDFTRMQLAIPGLYSYFMNLAHSTRSFPFGFGPGSSYTLAMKYFIDCEVIVFTLAVFIISLFLFKRKGIEVSILRAFEITSATILPLGLEIYFFDRFQFNIHASDIQVRTGLAWFTNADVLYLASSILATTLLIEALRHAARRGSKREVGIRPDLLHS